MRGALLAVGIAVSLAGCAAQAPRNERGEKVSYNYREVLPGSPGVFTGPDGVWEVYRRGGAAKGAPADAHGACDPATGSNGACPAPEPAPAPKRPPTVLLPAP
jgi:hypothetical protein